MKLSTQQILTELLQQLTGIAFLRAMPKESLCEVIGLMNVIDPHLQQFAMRIAILKSKINELDLISLSS